MKREEAFQAIRKERNRQEDLVTAGRFAWTCADPLAIEEAKLAVLMEEVGEVARVLCDKLKHSPAEVAVLLRGEIIQVAAVAVAWLESLPHSGLED